VAVEPIDLGAIGVQCVDRVADAYKLGARSADLDPSFSIIPPEVSPSRSHGVEIPATADECTGRSAYLLPCPRRRIAHIHGLPVRRQRGQAVSEDSQTVRRRSDFVPAHECPPIRPTLRLSRALRVACSPEFK